MQHHVLIILGPPSGAFIATFVDLPPLAAEVKVTKPTGRWRNFSHAPNNCHRHPVAAAHATEPGRNAGNSVFSELQSAGNPQLYFARIRNRQTNDYLLASNPSTEDTRGCLCRNYSEGSITPAKYMIAKCEGKKGKNPSQIFI